MEKWTHHGLGWSPIEIEAHTLHGIFSGEALHTLGIHLPSLHHKLLRDPIHGEKALFERHIISGIN